MTERNTTWDEMEWLYKMAQRSLLNIAPERGVELSTRTDYDIEWK